MSRGDLPTSGDDSAPKLWISGSSSRIHPRLRLRGNRLAGACYRKGYSGSIDRVKLSVSMSEDDVRTLDAHVAATGLPSRSAAVQEAVALLRHADLGEQYEAAWDEWDASGDRAAWDTTVGDGIT